MSTTSESLIGVHSLRSEWVPAEAFQSFLTAYSGDLLSEPQGKRNIPSVRTHEYKGFLYTTTATIHGGLSGLVSAEAWQLMPLDFYEGEVHSEDRISKGLKVQSHGRILVFNKPVTICCDVPSIALTLQQAKSCNEELSTSGWRGLGWRGAAVEWLFFGHHPVVKYIREDGKCIYRLLWLNAGHASELPVSSDQIALLTEEPPSEAICQSWEPLAMVQQPVQALLFA